MYKRQLVEDVHAIDNIDANGTVDVQAHALPAGMVPAIDQPNVGTSSEL